MNDEIKEILEEIDNKIIPNEHWNKIKDYITNLQKENKHLSKSYADAILFNQKRCEQNKELQQKIDRLKEENRHIFANVNDDVLLRSNAMNYAEAQDYKSRCEEAIEYLQEEGVCIMNKGKQENERLVWDWQNYYDLLNILNGGDE